MFGGIAIILVVLLIPVAVLITGAAASAVVGEVFYRDGKKDAHPELLDLPD
jgi:hypothetical protein